MAIRKDLDKLLETKKCPEGDLSGADLSFKVLVSFKNHLPVGANLEKADLRGANLSGSMLANANFREANLSGADLGEATLDGADFTGANLINASLWNAEMVGVNLTRANLNGAYLDKANLRSAIFSETVMPNGRMKNRRIKTKQKSHIANWIKKL